MEGGDFFLDGGGGVVFELGVVLVVAYGGSGGGGVVEVDVGEVLVGEEGEGLDGSVGADALGWGEVAATRMAMAVRLRIIMDLVPRVGVPPPPVFCANSSNDGG